MRAGEEAHVFWGMTSPYVPGSGMLCSLLGPLYHTGYLFLSSQILLFPMCVFQIGCCTWQLKAKGTLASPWQLAPTPVS